jgi:hypothetical protein
MTMKAEPGWRVMLKKPLERPPEPQDMPGEALYTLRVMPIRFWGFVVPALSEHLRRKPTVPDVSALTAILKMDREYMREGRTMISSSAVTQEQIVRPVPLGKMRKPYENVIDIVEPGETDKQALERVEAIFENERETRRLLKIIAVMES